MPATSLSKKVQRQEKYTNVMYIFKKIEDNGNRNEPRNLVFTIKLLRRENWSVLDIEENLKIVLTRS